MTAIVGEGVGKWTFSSTPGSNIRCCSCSGEQHNVPVLLGIYHKEIIAQVLKDKDNHYSVMLSEKLKAT